MKFERSEIISKDDELAIMKLEFNMTHVAESMSPDDPMKLTAGQVRWLLRGIMHYRHDADLLHRALTGQQT